MFLLIATEMNFAQLTHEFSLVARGGRFSYHVATGSGGQVFSTEFGLRSYRYDGNSLDSVAYFRLSSPVEVKVGPDGTVFVASGRDGLTAYTYDGTSLLQTASIDDSGFSISCAINIDNTVFLGCYKNGLRAYAYNGSSFVNTAYTNDSSTVASIAIASDGTVFTANWPDG